MAMDPRLQAVVNDFAKDTEAENKGRWTPFMSCEYLIARAHRNNTAFKLTFEKLMKPYRRIMEGGNIEGLSNIADDILKDVYAESVLLGVRDIATKETIPYSPDDGKELFRASPDLWDFVHKFATRDANYSVETDTKN